METANYYLRILSLLASYNRHPLFAITLQEMTVSAEHDRAKSFAGQQNGTPPPKEHSATDARHPVWSVEAGRMFCMWIATMLIL